MVEFGEYDRSTFRKRFESYNDGMGGKAMPWAVIPGMIIAQYVAKLAVVLLDTPLFYLGASLLGGGE